MKVLSIPSLLVALILLADGSAVRAQPQPQHRALAEVQYEARSALGKGVTQALLSNGLTVLVQENHAAPVATVRCFVRNTGSAFEGRFLGTGISHMLEHLVALGSTQKRGEDEIQRLLDSMGGQTNAFTTTNLTGYYVDCPADRVALAIELLADSMQYSLIPENEYLREMGVVQRELEMGRVERRRVLYEATKSLVYTEHPVRHPTIGYLPVVQSTTRQDVIAFYKNRYVPQNLVFVVAGDVATDEVLAEVLRNFKNFQRTTERGAVLPSEPLQASPRETHIEMPGETTHYAIAWPTVRLQHADLYPLDVASYLLTNGDSSRLGYRLKIEEPLAISVNSSSYTPGFVEGWFDVTFVCPPDQAAVCRRIVDEEIERLKTELVSPQELAKVKRQKAAEHVFAQQTVQEQANALAMSLLSTGDALFDDRYVEGIQQVTAEQVRDVARKYFLAERTNAIVIDPPGRRRQGGRQVAADVESPVLRKQLANGLTVLVKRHSVTPTVSIQAFVNAGVLSDTAETSGRAALATELLTRGTKKYSGREIAEFFDSIGGSFGTSSQRNTSFLQCAVLKDDFREALDYVHQVLFEPTFPADEFANLQRQQLARIAARKANPQTEILDYWLSLLPASSPYRLTVQGHPDTVSVLTAADCRAFHESFFVPNNMVLAIFGDVDPAATLEQLEQTFGRVPAAKSFQLPAVAERHDPVEGRHEQLVTQQPDTAMLIVGYPTVNALDQPTRAALDVLDTILTGGSGAGGRLFHELRGERLVYYVFGMQISGRAPGYFAFLAQTRPESRDEVIRRIQANVQRIADEGVAADEFALAKQKLTAAHAQSNTTPGQQAFQAAIDELYGLGYDHDKSYNQRIEQVTVEDVQQVVKKYFHHPIIATSSPAE